MPDTFQPQAIGSALQAILQQIRPVAQTESLSLDRCAGRALAATLASPQDVPESPLSAMDGYSLSSGLLNDKSPDLLIALKVLGKSLAGHGLEGKADRHGAVRIFTGAVVPPEHDTVIAQELVQFNDADQTVSFSCHAVKPRANVRQRGEDLQKGAPALARGTVIRARETALLASIGIAHVEVTRKIRVAVLSTGDEVAAPGSRLPAGKIFDANRPMLLQMVRECGAEAVDLGIIQDDAQSLKAAITQAAETADAVITSGGVSVGEADHTRKVMQSLGEISFWKLAIKPGRPLAAGVVGRQRVPFFGLPGNPVAAFVTFQAIVEPCLQQLAGSAPIARPPIRARLARDAKKAPGRTEYLRCALRRDAAGEWIAEIAASQGAASLKSLVDADGLVVLPHEAGPLPAGTAVDVILLR